MLVEEDDGHAIPLPDGAVGRRPNTSSLAGSKYTRHCSGPVGCWPSESVGQGSLVTKDQREVSTLSSRGQDIAAAPIRSITERPLLSPSSFTRRLIGFSCESLSLAGRRRVYHVPPLSPCGLGRVSPPVARRLRWRSSEPPDLATYLLVQACQHLALVLGNDGYDASPELTLPHNPGSRPQRCWQSQLGLTGVLPSWRMRLRCSGSFTPQGCP